MNGVLCLSGWLRRRWCGPLRRWILCRLAKQVVVTEFEDASFPYVEMYWRPRRTAEVEIRMQKPTIDKEMSSDG